jgi:hypothetical protein
MTSEHRERSERYRTPAGSMCPAKLSFAYLKIEILDLDGKLVDTIPGGKRLPAINAGLRKKKLEAISVLTEVDWTKQHSESSTKPARVGLTRWT